jgi:hypothetical protein
MNDRIAKLPKWAREHIENLQRERDHAVNQMHKMLDEQTPTSVWSDDIVCTNTPPQHIRRYFQARHLTIAHAGVELSIRMGEDECLKLSWHPHERGLTNHVMFVPVSFQQVELYLPENAR